MAILGNVVFTCPTNDNLAGETDTRIIDNQEGDRKIQVPQVHDCFGFRTNRRLVVAQKAMPDFGGVACLVVGQGCLGQFKPDLEMDGIELDGFVYFPTKLIER